MKIPSEAHHHSAAIDFKWRFFFSLGLTLLLLLPQDSLARFSLATALFFFGGWPFLVGAVKELQAKKVGMMTLIGLAISTAYGYSMAILAGLQGENLLLELATLIDVMLLGHYIEMRSTIGAGMALEKLVLMLPKMAHKRLDHGTVVEVPISVSNNNTDPSPRPIKISFSDLKSIAETSLLGESLNLLYTSISRLTQ